MEDLSWYVVEAPPDQVSTELGEEVVVTDVIAVPGDGTICVVCVPPSARDPMAVPTELAVHGVFESAAEARTKARELGGISDPG